MKSLILSENAQTTDDAFVVATIGTYSDIVLTGEALAPVTLKGWYGNVYSLFDGTPAAHLVFEGPCDVRMEVGHEGNLKINGSNIVWNNTGSLVLCAYSGGTSWTAETSVANCLPSGSQTGYVRIEKVTLDLKGNDQRVNGLVVNGKPALDSKVIVKDGKLVVWTRQGSVLVFR